MYTILLVVLILLLLGALLHGHTAVRGDITRAVDWD